MINLWTSPLIANHDFYHHDCLVQLSKVFDTEYKKAGKTTGSDGKPHVLMVLASWLFENSNWFRSLKGPKIIIEHDAYLNFMPQSPYYKCWTRFYRSCNFQLLISSGKETTFKLREDGLPVVWVPKGCNKEFLKVKNLKSGKFGYFGCPIAEQETGKKFYFYKSRYEMSAIVEDVFPLIRCLPKDFAETVTQYSACLVNDATMDEPMAKQFEISALGAAVIRDRQEELLDLGFVNHESVIMYDSWDEMKELCDFYSQERNWPKLKRIQRTARWVARNHTWEDRANQIYGIVKPFLKDRVYL